MYPPGEEKAKGKEQKAKVGQVAGLQVASQE
jgi:hypothetical protein